MNNQAGISALNAHPSTAVSLRANSADGLPYAFVRDTAITVTIESAVLTDAITITVTFTASADCNTLRSALNSGTAFVFTDAAGQVKNVTAAGYQSSDRTVTLNFNTTDFYAPGRYCTPRMSLVANTATSQ